MTFTQIKTRIMTFCALSSTEADTRIGIAINQHYKRVTALLGLDPVRFVTRNASTTNGVQTVTFGDIEKIDRVIDATISTAIVRPTEVSLDAIRSTQPGTGAPTRWAVQNTHADSVTIVLDTLPQTTYSLQADGTSTVGDMSGSDEPLFSESFHDILSFLVISEELLKKEKIQLAREFASGDENRPGRAEVAIRELRFKIADSPGRDTQQGAGTVMGASGSSGGSGNVGGTAYTQTALITFDRDPSAPFAVTDTSAYVPNLFTEGVGNVTTDRLIGRDTAGTGESEQLTVSGGLEFTGAGGIQIANDGVTYAKIQNISATSRLLGRKTAAAGDTEEVTLSEVLDFIGSAARGDLLYRGAATWARLAAGTSGQLLKTLGSGADPLWANPALQLLYANSGTDTNAGATTVDSIAISGLTAKDTLTVELTLASVTQQTTTPLLYHVTDALTVVNLLSGGASLAAGGKRIVDARIRQYQSAATAIGVFANSTDGFSVNNPTFTTNWTGSWTLGLRHGGVTAGGTFQYSWAVYRLVGQ